MVLMPSLCVCVCVAIPRFQQQLLDDGKEDKEGKYSGLVVLKNCKCCRASASWLQIRELIALDEMVYQSEKQGKICTK